jgi:predicted transcriptional regulator
MPNPSFRVSDEFYEKMRATAEAQNVSMSDLIRTAVEHAIEGNGKPSDTLNESLTAVLREQLQEKDGQIRELHQLVAMSQKHSDDLMRQLDSTNRQLEDHRERRWWWRWRK